MLIRQLLPEDASLFQAIRLRGLLENPTAFGSSHPEEADTPIPVIAQRLVAQPAGATLGAFQGGALVGLIGIMRPTKRKLAHKAFIWGMYVVPELRLKGVGRALVSKALEIAANGMRVRAVTLDVNTQNKAAVSLYKSMGFTIYGTEVGALMIDGELHDEYLMTIDVGAARKTA